MQHPGALAGLILASCLAAVGAAEAQTFTMGKDCRAALDAADASNEAGDFAAALSGYDAVVKKCDTKDARTAIQVGRAHALNGMGQHADALAAADAALAVSKRPSLDAYFERAVAHEKLGEMEAATADYNKILELTEKNQNVRERATIYVKVADMYAAAGKTAEAESYLAKAVELDPANTDAEVVRGDWAVRAGAYDAAFAAYDQAVAKGRTDLAMYQIRTEARMKQMQDKYGTTNAQELRGKMTPDETALVCQELKKALELGLRDPKLDMFSALVCK